MPHTAHQPTSRPRASIEEFLAEMSESEEDRRTSAFPAPGASNDNHHLVLLHKPKKMLL
jgi:hypothetical protein